MYVFNAKLCQMNDPSYEKEIKTKEKEKKGRRDDATHLRLHPMHALTPPHTSVHTFCLLPITLTF